MCIFGSKILPQSMNVLKKCNVFSRNAYFLQHRMEMLKYSKYFLHWNLFSSLYDLTCVTICVGCNCWMIVETIHAGKEDFFSVCWCDVSLSFVVMVSIWVTELAEKPPSQKKCGLRGWVAQKTVTRKGLLAPTQEAKTQSCALAQHLPVLRYSLFKIMSGKTQTVIKVT